MSFRGWLPITARNRVALCLSALSLVLFLVWNFLPYQNGFDGPSEEIFATHIWPEVFSPGIYTHAIRTPIFDDSLVIICFLSLPLSGLVILMGVPLWKVLHASNYIRLPLALMNLIGGSAIAWIPIKIGLSFGTNPIFFAPLVFMILSMFSVSAALFIYKNELALRNGR